MFVITLHDFTRYVYKARGDYYTNRIAIMLRKLIQSNYTYNSNPFPDSSVQRRGSGGSLDSGMVSELILQF